MPEWTCYNPPIYTSRFTGHKRAKRIEVFCGQLCRIWKITMPVSKISNDALESSPPFTQHVAMITSTSFTGLALNII